VPNIEPETKDPDYDGYSKSLEKILDGVTKDYWVSYVDVNRHQVNIAKTYLWVSAAQLGVYAAAYKEFHSEIFGHSCFLVIGILAFSSCCIAFGICLYAIPSRKGYKLIPDIGWGEFSQEAYSYLDEGNARVYASLLTSLIAKIDNALQHNFHTNQVRASILRYTSWFLIFSFILAVFLAASLSVDNLLKISAKNKVYEMSNEDSTSQNNTTSSSSATVTPTAKLQVPQPPPPANITGNSKSTFALENYHALDSASQATIIIENKSVKK